MKVIIHDLGTDYDEIFKAKCDETVHADGKYAACQGCFSCWTKHPAACFIQDKLESVCRTVGRADELIVISKNCYGTYSPSVKAVLDRSIGLSTPMSTYRGKQMHHTLRYGRHKMIQVYTYGSFLDNEKSSFELMVNRNAVNYGYENSEIVFIDDIASLMGMI